MKIILISSRVEKVRTLSLNSWAKGFLSVLLLGIPVAAGTMLGVKIADGRWELLFDNSISEMQHQLVVQQEQVDTGREQLGQLTFSNDTQTCSDALSTGSIGCAR